MPSPLHDRKRKQISGEPDPAAPVNPDDITIAITVFDRRQFIEQAIVGALGQTLPARVMVVEDCGPDAGLQAFVRGKFGARLGYHRNPRRRGLFDNWNACLELCQTPWLCICHDDDFLAPCFVEAMVQLAQRAPGRGLYYGRVHIVDPVGRPLKTHLEPAEVRWRDMDLVDAAYYNPVPFPGELFRADHARALGGFRPTSFFTGDWEMWMQLAIHHGATATNRVVGNSRAHESAERGTTRVDRSGKRLAFVTMQCKRNLALLRQHGSAATFDRAALQRRSPLSTRYLLQCGAGFSSRMLAYNVGLLLRSESPNWRHWGVKVLAAALGPRVVGMASKLSLAFKGAKRAPHNSRSAAARRRF
jgi:hypothetical protein